MRIGVSAPFRLHGGGELYLQRVFAEWARSGALRSHDVVLYTRPENVAPLGLDPAVSVRTASRGDMSSAARIAWENRTIPRLAAQDKVDVLFCPGGTVPIRLDMPTVVAFRNAAPFCPSVTAASVGLPAWTEFKLIGALMRRAAQRAARVIFISRAFRDLFVEKYGFDPSRGDVIHNGNDGSAAAADADAIIARYQLTEPYLLGVGHLYGYKRYDKLIQGYALARERGLATDLVLAGRAIEQRKGASLVELAKELGVAKHVRFLGAVPQQYVAALMEHCRAFVFQSTCENCPNTLLQAMRQGAAIMSADRPVMRELAGDGATYYDPLDASAIATTLLRIDGDRELRTDLARIAAKRAELFPSWSETAAAILKVLEGIPGRRA